MGEPPGAADADTPDTRERPRHGRGHGGGRGRSERPRDGGERSERGPKPAKRHEAAPAPKHREAPPAPVTMLDEARGRRPSKPAPQPESGTESHLPAFLLRPTRVKA